MDGITLPYLPTTLWLLSAALTIIVLLIFLGYHLYFRGRAGGLIKDGEKVAALAARITTFQADEEAIRDSIQIQKSELDRLTVEREDQERLRALLSDLEQQCAAKDQENQSLRNEVGELENQRHNLSQTLEKLEREIGDLDNKRSEAQALDGRLSELKDKLDDARKIVRGLAVEQAKLDALVAEKVSLDRVVEDLRSSTDSAQVELREYMKQAEKARAGVEKAQAEAEKTQAEAEKAKSALAQNRKEKSALDVIMASLRYEQAELDIEIDRKEQIIDDLKTSSKTAMAEAEKNIGTATKARADVQMAEGELAGVIKKRQRLELEIGELNARKVALEQELARLQGSLGTPVGDEELKPYADIIEVTPDCLHKDAFSGGPKSEEDESQILQVFKDQLRDENLKFPPRIIDAFHTSLKCHNINPLTVLAGVSGTGKTLLPMYYAKLMGMHSMVMAVQPRWDSPQDMFGFYNYLEKEYKATELSRALVRMDPFNYNDGRFSKLDCEWTRHRMLLVLLDEMNLARTEYYFSEFLSKLELRRMVKNPEDKNDRQRAEITLDTGPGKTVQFRIWVDYNVLFVGTMNQDETTQTLSDKVLDRANVLRFGKPDEKTQCSQIDMQGENWVDRYLPFDLWQSWIKSFGEHTAWSEQITKWTNRLNDALDRVGRPFGYRVQQAIRTYVANYPRVEDEGRYKLAFADQLEQKIMPKLQGVDLANNATNISLDVVEAVIAELDDQELGEAFRMARDESQAVGMFQWRGVTRPVEENY